MHFSTMCVHVLRESLNPYRLKQFLKTVDSANLTDENGGDGMSGISPMSVNSVKM